MGSDSSISRCRWAHAGHRRTFRCVSNSSSSSQITHAAFVSGMNRGSRERDGFERAREGMAVAGTRDSGKEVEGGRAHAARPD